MTLPDHTQQAIETELTRFPNKQSAMMNVLHLVQESQGYLSDAAIDWVAGKLGLSPIKVLEVVTFYPMFRRQPVGKVHVTICRTLSCALCGSYTIREKLEAALGCKIGGVSSDGAFSLDWGECLGSCGTGPVVHVNGALYENVKADNLDGFIQTVKGTLEQPAVPVPEAGTPAYMG
jgi:NADH-quinone oxidoreductase subunit E